MNMHQNVRGKLHKYFRKHKLNIKEATYNKNTANF